MGMCTRLKLVNPPAGSKRARLHRATILIGLDRPGLEPSNTADKQARLGRAKSSMDLAGPQKFRPVHMVVMVVYISHC